MLLEKQAGQIAKTDHNFCNNSCAATYNNSKRIKKLEKTVNCKYCNNVFIVPRFSVKKVCDVCRSKGKSKLYQPKIYCCITCNNSIQSRDGKKKYCNHCRLFAWQALGKRIGKLSAAKQVRRSKNEIYFAELCEQEFAKISTNDPIFISKYGNWDADIIVHDHKIAILWNGIWHYKQVRKNHSLQQVQSRDKIKLDVITNNGYIPYVICDMGKYNKLFVEEEFDKFKKYIITNHLV
jgi:hypothetical protein